MSDQRGSVLDSLRRHPDPAQSRDPEVRAVVDALGQLDIAPAPDEQFRHELRAQLVAVAPRLMAEGAAEPRHLRPRLASDAGTPNTPLRGPARSHGHSPSRPR